MLDAASRTPLLGGGGIDTFWNVGLAGPITGLVPPYLTGAAVNITTQPAQISPMLYDPRHAQQTTGLEDWGEDGVTGRLSVTFRLRIAGRAGYHTLMAVGSNRKGTDLADIPYLLLPPEVGEEIGIKKGTYYLGYSVQQYLWQDPNTPGAGWGIFGQAGMADGNPNPFT
jgi:porin